MNILVIGNGFDLAHGLPTKYTDFLEWIILEANLWKKLKLEGREQANRIKMLPLCIQIPDNKIVEIEGKNIYIDRQIELWDCVNHNIWIDYFLQNPMYQKENWIDFESEISRVVKSMDNDMKKFSAMENTTVRNISEQFFAEYFLEDLISKEQDRDAEGLKLCENMPVNKQLEFLDEYKNKHPVKPLKEEITYKEMITRLEADLNRLIRALEIYLVDFLGRIRVTKIIKDIENLNIDHVLSFNYTDTYEKLYDKDNNIQYDYIHGKADANNTTESNNMVLGIDEYLLDGRENTDVDFIAFKKFYQRIHKQTGCKYKEWMDQIRNEWKKETGENKAGIRRRISYGKLDDEKIHRLYIFGHSLDVTDKDILRDLILNDNVHTTIFYLNKDVMGQQIANLVKVIHQDELIKRTGGSTKTIEFVPIPEMIEIEENAVKII